MRLAVGVAVLVTLGVSVSVGVIVAALFGVVLGSTRTVAVGDGPPIARGGTGGFPATQPVPEIQPGGDDTTMYVLTAALAGDSTLAPPHS